MSRIWDDAYDEGYRNGESSAHADWTGALSEVLPTWFGRDPQPSRVAEYIEELQTSLQWTRHLVWPDTHYRTHTKKEN